MGGSGFIQFSHTGRSRRRDSNPHLCHPSLLQPELRNWRRAQYWPAFASGPRNPFGSTMGIGAVGLVLLVMMVAVESEPGAIPLALLLIAAVGYITGRMRERSSKVR
jgi:hypothetical protein